ncbi:MAG: site-specific integrase [Clostridia bacterium]|nr:site-specific integrase [Clostridia bacterium]
MLYSFARPSKYSMNILLVAASSSVIPPLALIISSTSILNFLNVSIETKSRYTFTSSNVKISLADISASLLRSCSGTSTFLIKALNMDTDKLFTFERDTTPLSNKTITEYHRLISTVLSQAEREMLVQYNAAHKATPPKLEKKEVECFQPEEVIQIRDCLEHEPLKWKTITHMLLITGCRRGEVMGLHWDAVDWPNNQIKIDRALLYSPKKGIYEDTTKTRETRFIKLPQETMQLLKDYK